MFETQIEKDIQYVKALVGSRISLHTSNTKKVDITFKRLGNLVILNY